MNNTNQSLAFIELVNLRNSALKLSPYEQKSKKLLKATGRRLIRWVWPTERQAAIHILAQEW